MTSEQGKAQWVRLLDVFALGPLMIYVATAYPLREPERSLLLVTGIGTIIYNGMNYVAIERAEFLGVDGQVSGPL